MYNKQTLKETLQNRVGTVVFTKSDGSERTMKCTLQESFFPIVEQKTDSSKVRVDNPDVLAVWDIDSAGWRSFKISSIISTDF